MREKEQTQHPLFVEKPKEPLKEQVHSLCEVQENSWEGQLKTDTEEEKS